ncbi:MAG: hypothetical protein JWN04_5215 [Myxococcaceae bacterium]|nr:hypothetical protein [Myxococcaceae bacterium]
MSAGAAGYRGAPLDAIGNVLRLDDDGRFVIHRVAVDHRVAMAVGGERRAKNVDLCSAGAAVRPTLIASK